jgi:methylenetetrahydrofolate dehydrogenase (NADP+) / methenyltetrahydrofolate cyclohydrolase
MPILLDGRSLTREIQNALGQEARLLPRPPGLGVILVGHDPASRVYVDRKAAAATRLGFHHVQIDLPEQTTEAELVFEVDRLAEDPAIDGFLVQIPLPPGIRRDRVLDRIPATKDVDGVHPENLGLLALGRPRFVACTPAGIMRLLERGGVPLAGRTATVIGRSAIVGRPMSLLLDRANATVTMCHSGTADLEACVRRADVLVVAIGRPHAIPGTWVKPGAAVVDVGMHRLPDGRLIGDVDPDGLDAAGWVTPVPGGVGPMTIAMLLSNTLEAARRSQVDRA